MSKCLNTAELNFTQLADRDIMPHNTNIFISLFKNYSNYTLLDFHFCSI